MGNVKRQSGGKGKGKGNRRYAGAELVPNTWEQLSYYERWWLEELWNGNLKQNIREAEWRHGGRVQADRFAM